MVSPDRKCVGLLLAGALSLGGCAHQSAAVTAGSMPTASIAGTSWWAEEIEGQPIINPAETALRVDPSGRISGSTGCNTFTGSATISTYNMKMSPLATTRRARDPELMAQEQRFLNALGAVRKFSIDGEGQLHLLASDGKPLARLSRTNP